MNCPTCGLEQPENISHLTLDWCQVALVAAQDAVRLTIAEQLKRIEQEVRKKDFLERKVMI